MDPTIKKMSSKKKKRLNKYIVSHKFTNRICKFGSMLFKQVLIKKYFTGEKN
jgi:hypothetical protein